MSFCKPVFDQNRNSNQTKILIETEILTEAEILTETENLTQTKIGTKPIFWPKSETEFHQNDQWLICLSFR